MLAVAPPRPSCPRRAVVNGSRYCRSRRRRRPRRPRRPQYGAAVTSRTTSTTPSTTMPTMAADRRAPPHHAPGTRHQAPPSPRRAGRRAREELLDSCSRSTRRLPSRSGSRAALRASRAPVGRLAASARASSWTVRPTRRDSSRASKAARAVASATDLATAALATVARVAAAWAASPGGCGPAPASEANRARRGGRY